ncbi:MAG: ATP-binding protein [Planctomycetales bacterium]|nr:ATP-binding protein [Planctomycetales bacterium]
MRYLRRPWTQLAIPAALIAVIVGSLAAIRMQRLWGDALAGAIAVVVVASLLLLADVVRIYMPLDRLKLREALGWRSLSSLRCSQRAIPPYRTVDLFRACTRFAEEHDALVLDAATKSPLWHILADASWRRMTAPLSTKFEVGPGEHEWLPNDRFWLLRVGEAGRRDTVIRMRLHVDEYRGTLISLEIASCGQAPEEIIDQLTKDALRNSIYRGHVVRMQTGEGLRDDIGTEAQGHELRMSFCTDQEVRDEDIILDDKIHEILRRNVFSFHELRERLAEYGIPQRRGLLLFGPPGTGKTYACRYMYSKLENVTALIVTGQALLRLKSICELARMLQPSLLVLEDVDLVFSERELNPNATTLGDMLDELDGFQSDDAITVVLTTNAIERVERAVKDRPGRISQCVYMAPPTGELRLRYLKRFLRQCDTQTVEFDKVVQQTRGASQAFLKEMVFRAIQVGVERDPPANGATLRLITADFLIAIDEMISQTEKSAKSIIGLIG